MMGGNPAARTMARNVRITEERRNRLRGGEAFEKRVLANAMGGGLRFGPILATYPAGEETLHVSLL